VDLTVYHSPHRSYPVPTHSVPGLRRHWLRSGGLKCWAAIPCSITPTIVPSRAVMTIAQASRAAFKSNSPHPFLHLSWVGLLSSFLSHMYFLAPSCSAGCQVDMDRSGQEKPRHKSFATTQVFCTALCTKEKNGSAACCVRHQDVRQPTSKHRIHLAYKQPCTGSVNSRGCRQTPGAQKVHEVRCGERGHSCYSACLFNCAFLSKTFPSYGPRVHFL
jgi:hypothetical protein